MEQGDGIALLLRSYYRQSNSINSKPDPQYNRSGSNQVLQTYLPRRCHQLESSTSNLEQQHRFLMETLHYLTSPYPRYHAASMRQTICDDVSPCVQTLEEVDFFLLEEVKLSLAWLILCPSTLPHEICPFIRCCMARKPNLPSGAQLPSTLDPTICRRSLVVTATYFRCFTSNLWLGMNQEICLILEP